MYVPQYFVTIHLTRLCNNRCKFCTTDSLGHGPSTIPLDQYEKILMENANQGFEAVHVIGGEPTILQQLPDILNLIQKYNYPITKMFTNARRLAQGEYAKQIVDLRVSLFVISVHGHNSEIHDWLTGIQGSFDEALKGIANVKELGQEVEAVAVITKQNYRHLKEIVNVLMNARVDLINLTSLCPGGLAILNWENLAVSYKEVFPYLQEAIEACRSSNRDLVLEGFPFCAVQPHERLCAEYAGTRKEKLYFHEALFKDYDTHLNEFHKTRVSECYACSVRNRCGGIYKEYYQKFGKDGCSPFKDQTDDQLEAVNISG